jgi:hypothetical protein
MNALHRVQEWIHSEFVMNKVTIQSEPSFHCGHRIFTDEKDYVIVFFDETYDHIMCTFKDMEQFCFRVDKVVEGWGRNRE